MSVSTNRATYDATITVATDAKVSSSVYLAGRSLVGVVLPAQWTASDLTFKVSTDGTTFHDLYASTGLYTYPTAGLAAGAASVFDATLFNAWDYVQVRSVTDQAADRVLTLIAK
jgi:hypothetical protein